MAFNTIDIIGAPLDLGANLRGANMGPSAIRIAGLRHKLEELGFTVMDRGDLAIPVRETLSNKDEAQKYLPQILQACDLTRYAVIDSLNRGNMPLVLGGDHSLALGTIAGSAEHCRRNQQSLGLLWFDAHADFNTMETSPTGNIHGMPLAATLGLGRPELVNIGGFAPKVKPEHAALIGIRILDAGEKELLRQSGVRYFTMREIDERGMYAVMQEAIAVASRATGGIHVSFDLDGIDPLFAPGVSTPVTGGLSFREAHLALEMVADSKRLKSLEMVELNPTQDRGPQTAQLVVDLVQSAFGKSII